MAVTITQAVNLSLTENLVPPIVHVKQFDNQARKIRCTFYDGAVEYSIPDGAILSCSGTRPDGNMFQYSSESAEDLVYFDGNYAVFTITEFMTALYGRVPVDLMLLSEDGDVLGAFSLILRVERAAASNGNIATITVSKAAAAIAEEIYEVFITDDGYFAIRSNDGLGVTSGTESSTISLVLEGMMDASITDDGHLAIATDGLLGLSFSMDDEGHLVVTYGEA